MSSIHFATFLGLHDYEIWIMAIGALACGASGLIGSFLILRRMALMGDAISHSVLPGIAIAVMITGQLSSFIVLIGASIVGIFTPYLIDLLKSSGRIHEDASIGVVFTVLFSIGVLLVSRMGNVDLDVDCVLYGEIATAPFDTLTFLGYQIGPRGFWTLLVVFIANVIFLTLFFKELKITTFDEELAKAIGFRPKWIHYLLLGMVSLTTIASFESVGSIIVVAMLIAPGATAYLLTDRLGVMLFLSALIGVLSSIAGYLSVLALGGELSIAGAMASCVGLFFGLAFLFSPQKGIVSKYWRRWRLALRFAREHILADLYRAQEAGQVWSPEAEILKRDNESFQRYHSIAKKLLHSGSLLWEEGKLRLTSKGMSEAKKLVRAHRLWESFLEKKLGVAADHVHRSADDTEHFLSSELQEQIERSLEGDSLDPHGKPIPRRN